MLTTLGARRTLSLDEAVALLQASDPRVSPDGRLVAFCVAPLSYEGEHPRGAIYVAPADGSAPARPFTGGRGLDAAPRWSPDGRRLAFVSDRHEPGTPKLYVMPSDGGEARSLGDQRGEASNPQWSPDGEHIAVLLTEIDSPEVERRKKERRDDAIVVDDDKYTRLWLVDLRSGTMTQLTPERLNIWLYAWSPGSAEIAVLHSPAPQVNDAYGSYRLSVLAIDNGNGASRAMREVCPLYGDTIASLCWSPDGTRLAVVGPEGQRPFTLAATAPLVIPAMGGQPRAVFTGRSTECNWVGWLTDDELAVAGDEDLGSVFYRVPLDGGEPSPLFPGGQPHGAPRELSLSADRKTLAYTWEDTTSPGDLWAAPLGSPPRRLTTLNPSLDERAWGAVEPVAWSAPDGLPIHGLLMKPVGYQPGRRYPTVVHVHGGPAWLWSDRFYASWHDWDQLLAGRGYAVLLPNPRGSTGRGSAFVRGNYADFGGGEWDDVYAGAQWAIAAGIADPARLGLGGWSWGGYLTAWGVTQTDLFKAAVMGAGCSNLVSDHGQNNCPDMNRLYFPNLPYADAAPYWDRSPIRHVARASTPTLFLHGERDDIVALPQAREFYRALKTLGVPVEMVVYPREPHGIRERTHQLDLLRRVLTWFDLHLRPDAASPIQK